MKVFRTLTYILVGLLISCNNSNEGTLSTDVISNPNSASGDSKDKLPFIEFEKDIHDFGKLIQGEKATFNFRFTNTGKSDLVITQVQTTCGCTVPKFPKTAIKPGEGEVIKVTFDSSGRKGTQNKMITVTSNCQPNTSVLRIKAQVITP
jgi:hypothetical protein